MSIAREGWCAGWDASCITLDGKVPKFTKASCWTDEFVMKLHSSPPNVGQVEISSQGNKLEGRTYDQTTLGLDTFDVTTEQGYEQTVYTRVGWDCVPATAPPN